MIDIYDYLCFDGMERSWTQKVEYILKNESQRAEFRTLTSCEEKANFFLNHFVMNDLAARQLTATFQKDETMRQEFIHRIEYIIDILDNKRPIEKMDIQPKESLKVQV